MATDTGVKAGLPLVGHDAAHRGRDSSVGRQYRAGTEYTSPDAICGAGIWAWDATRDFFGDPVPQVGRPTIGFFQLPVPAT